MERKVSTEHLLTGMYVSNLDRPWLDTPFLLQGFVIKGQEDIDALQKFCEFVFIDTEQGTPADIYLDEPAELDKHYVEDFLQAGKRMVDYENQSSLLQEQPVSEQTLDQASVKVANIMDNLKTGDSLDLQAVRSAIQPMLDSMIRNSDTLLWMLRLRENDEYSYQHATDNCVLALAFGRFLGLYKEDLRTLAMGMLLLDVGKVKIAPEILNKPGILTKAEFSVAKKHVDFGVQILRDTPGVSEAVIEIVQTHHERFDGSGYPQGLKDKQIPIYGRIAAIIDHYTAMTRKTPYRNAIAQHTVLQELYRWRDKYFQAELVEQFLQCMGVYPTGSLVEMTSGEVGVIVAQNKHERLKPTILMVLDEEKKPCEVKTLVDMSVKQVDSTGLELKILHALNPGSYGIEPGDAMPY